MTPTWGKKHGYCVVFPIFSDMCRRHYSSSEPIFFKILFLFIVLFCCLFMLKKTIGHHIYFLTNIIAKQRSDSLEKCGSSSIIVYSSLTLRHQWRRRYKILPSKHVWPDYIMYPVGDQTDDCDPMTARLSVGHANITLARQSHCNTH